MEQTNIYPDLTGHISSNQLYHDRVREMRKELVKAQANRKKLYKRYSKANSVMHIMGVGISFCSATSTVGGLTALSTGIGAPIGLALGGVATAMVATGTVVFGITKHFTNKKAKHAHKLGILNTGVATLDQKFGKALTDNVITAEEFQQMSLDYTAIMAQVAAQKPQDKIQEQTKKEVTQKMQQILQAM